MARKLYRAYTSSRGQYRAMHDTNGQSDWSQVVPLGAPWTGPITEESSANVGITAKNPRASKISKTMPAQESSESIGISTAQPKKCQKGKVKNAEQVVPPDDFKGDRVLARSIALMRDLMWSRECAYAVAEGDTGRLYEILKVKLARCRQSVRLN